MRQPGWGNESLYLKHVTKLQRFTAPRGLRQVVHMVRVILAITVVYSRLHAGSVSVVWRRTNLGSFLQFADSSGSRVVVLLLNFSRVNSQRAWSTQRARRSCEGLLLDDGSHWKWFKMPNFQLTCPQRINTCHYFRKPPSIHKHPSKSFCFRLSSSISLSSFVRQRGTPLIDVWAMFCCSNIFGRQWRTHSCGTAASVKIKRLEQNWGNYEVSLNITKDIPLSFITS